MITDAAHECRKELDVIIPIFIVNDRGNAKHRARLGLCAEFTAQPTHRQALFFLIDVAPRAVINVDHARKVKCADTRFDLAKHRVDAR